LDNIPKYISNFIKFIGTNSAWLNLCLVILICFDVLQRYLFNQTYNAVLELEWHFFGLIFLLGSAYTLQVDKHVRVDILYSKMSEKNKAIIDAMGSLILLVPWCIVGIITCYKYASNSLYIHESSPNPGGLPAWFIIKFVIVLCFILILLQGIINIIQKMKLIVR
jgi:TRAP-type mannitol/chloroaromatic compound transport system permease small subunit